MITPRGTMAYGWNECCAGRLLSPAASDDEIEGYFACQKVPKAERIPFNADTPQKILTKVSSKPGKRAA